MAPLPATRLKLTAPVIILSVSATDTEMSALSERPLRTVPVRTGSDRPVNKVNTLSQRTTHPTTSPTFTLRRGYEVSRGHAGCAMIEVKDPDQVIEGAWEYRFS